MSFGKRLKTALIKVLVTSQEERHNALMKSIAPPLVVLGFPRSGTSMVGQLAHQAGYFFGESEDGLKPDKRNPKGYFEYGPLFRISRTFLREAGVRGDLDPVPNGFRARGFLNRIQRAYTRRAMMSMIDELATRSPFGLKLFPRFYYFWKPYLPKSTKVVAIYREPEAVVRSFMSAWPGGYTADQVLAYWVEHNRDLLFHIENAESQFLLKYEDLLNPEVQATVLSALEQYLGVPAEKFSGVIEESLNRSGANDHSFPLPEAVSTTLTTLDQRRRYA